MRTKLPTLQVTSCSYCPLCDREFDYCQFPGVPDTDRPSNDDVYRSLFGHPAPTSCPGRKYDIALEFPDEVCSLPEED